MENQLEQLKQMTVVVADTSEFEEIKEYKPTNATTNPSLILAASTKPEYQFLIDEAVSWGRNKKGSHAEKLTFATDKVFVNFGLKILEIIPGNISTEVDARLSFDVKGSIKKARDLIALYELAGVDRSRVLIKLASTWEGIKAAKQLEKEGIHCNMTLLFSLVQAIACAKVEATVVSPFVGRILDWYKEHKESFPPAVDPGVLSVKEIYHYYKKMNIKTKVMGASFRNLDEIIELAGCDLLTISPKFLKELQTRETPLLQKLSPQKAETMDIKKIPIDQKKFRWMLCYNSMASDKLYDGIRRFADDIAKLEQMLSSKMG